MNRQKNIDGCQCVRTLAAIFYKNLDVVIDIYVFMVYI